MAKIAQRYSKRFEKSACLNVELPFLVSSGARHLWRKWTGLQQLGTGRTLLGLQFALQSQFHPPPCTFCSGSLGSFLAVVALKYSKTSCLDRGVLSYELCRWRELYLVRRAQTAQQKSKHDPMNTLSCVGW